MDTVDRPHSTAPSRKPTLSIRARLVILALLAVVPLMLDRVRLLEQTRQERIEDASTEAVELARRGADGQREIIITAKAMLQVMARAYVGMIATGTTCNFYLNDLVAGMPGSTACRSSAPTARSNARPSRTRSASTCPTGRRSGPRWKRASFAVSNYVDRPSDAEADLGRGLSDASHRSPAFRAAVMTSIDLQWVECA